MDNPLVEKVEQIKALQVSDSRKVEKLNTFFDTLSVDMQLYLLRETTLLSETYIHVSADLLNNVGSSDRVLRVLSTLSFTSTKEVANDPVFWEPIYPLIVNAASSEVYLSVSKLLKSADVRNQVILQKLYQVCEDINLSEEFSLSRFLLRHTAFSDEDFKKVTDEAIKQFTETLSTPFPSITLDTIGMYDNKITPLLENNALPLEQAQQFEGLLDDLSHPSYVMFYDTIRTFVAQRKGSEHKIVLKELPPDKKERYSQLHAANPSFWPAEILAAVNIIQLTRQTNTVNDPSSADRSW